MDPRPDNSTASPKNYIGAAVAIGIALGAALGATFGHLAIGIVLGIVFGLVIGAARSRRGWYGATADDTEI